MKEHFLELVHQAENIRKMAHRVDLGGVLDYDFVIYDVREFINWKQKLLCELQQFSKKDEFIKNTINIINKINGCNDEIDFNELCGALNAIEGMIDNYYEKETLVKSKLEKKETKVFISHSSKDVEYIKEFVNLLEDIGLGENDIVCSSIPPYSIPLNKNVYEWLVDKFQNCDLHVVYMLSNNYYESAVCLNEMGAAWAMQQKWTGILLPGFDFKDIQGCIEKNQISIKLDDNDVHTLKHRLGELKDIIIKEFSLNIMSSSRWERKRDEFITKINTMASEKKRIEKVDTMVEKTTIKKSNKININSCVMLAYASDDDNGEIVYVEYLDGASIMTKNTEFIKYNTPREVAMWKAALNELREQGYLECKGDKDKIYTVTNSGYVFSDQIKKQLNIDTSKDFEEYVHN